MIDAHTSLYLFTFVSALILSLILTPAARSAALIFDIIDHPSSKVKTHKEPVPYLGGVAIYLAFAFSLLWIRVLTSFPTGTLRATRGIFLGGSLVFIVGLVDDIRHGGLDYRMKFLIQILAALVVMSFGIRIRFIQPAWLAYGLTLVWIVGITNAFNIIDIMDGLSSGIGAIAALFFLFISLPTEDIYVNFAAAALAGGAFGFIPYNLSRHWRIFMGDSGSLLIGFISGALALGTSYSGTSKLAVLSPLLILAVPIFDTLLVMTLRITRGMSPFLGSKDHFPLRMERLGWNRSAILFFCWAMGGLFGAGAAVASRMPDQQVMVVFILYFIFLTGFVLYLLKAKVE